MALSLVSSRFIEQAKGDAVKPISVDKLLLDTENPRLRLPPNASQKYALRQLYEGHRLEELMASLLTNGYFDEEPLVAVPSTREGFFTVVEGNRRLAALKLLTDSNLAVDLKITNIPKSSPEHIERLKEVPVKVYPRRELILPYLGFRHITGIKEWDAESKARYVYQLRHKNKLELDNIATMIGDTYRMTERLYLGWALIQQAEEETGFSQNEVYKFPFSYMYDAVRMPEVKKFLGLSDNEYKVDKKHVNELQDLTKWLFGNKPHQIQPIVERKDQLKQLAYAVSDPNGVKALRNNRSLEEAYQLTVGERDQLTTWLTAASSELDRAKGILHRHKKDKEIRDLVMQCSETVSAMARELGT